MHALVQARLVHSWCLSVNKLLLQVCFVCVCLHVHRSCTCDLQVCTVFFISAHTRTQCYTICTCTCTCTCIPVYLQSLHLCICALNSTRVCREPAGYKPRCSRPWRGGQLRRPGWAWPGAWRGAWQWVWVVGPHKYVSLSFLDSPLFNFLFPPSLIFYFRAKGCPVHAVHITRGSRPSD